MKRCIWTLLAVAIAAGCLASEARATFTLNITGPGGYNQNVVNGTDSINFIGPNTPLPSPGVPGINIFGSITSTYTISGLTATITTGVTTLQNTSGSAITLVFTATESQVTSSSTIPTITTGLTFLSGSGSAVSSTLINGLLVTGSTTATLTSKSDQTTVNPTVNSPFSFTNKLTVTINANSTISVQSTSDYNPYAPNVTPEPSTLIALATALPMLGFSLRRRKSSQLSPATA